MMIPLAEKTADLPCSSKTSYGSFHNSVSVSMALSPRESYDVFLAYGREGNPTAIPKKTVCASNRLALDDAEKMWKAV